MAVQAALPVDLLGRKYNESGTGAMVTSLGIAHAMLHPVTGWLMDTYQDAALPFAIFGVAQLLGGLISVFVWIPHRKIKETDSLQLKMTLNKKDRGDTEDGVVITLMN